jgi:hypothetical protein
LKKQQQKTRGTAELTSPALCFILFIFVVVRLKLRALHMQGKYSVTSTSTSATELHPNLYAPF